MKVIELNDGQFLGKFHVGAPLSWGTRSNTLIYHKIEICLKQIKEVNFEYEESNDENNQIYKIEEQMKLYQIDF